jgi:hypothetical protein
MSSELVAIPIPLLIRFSNRSYTKNRAVVSFTFYEVILRLKYRWRMLQ